MKWSIQKIKFSTSPLMILVIGLVSPGFGNPSGNPPVTRVTLENYGDGVSTFRCESSKEIVRSVLIPCHSVKDCREKEKCLRERTGPETWTTCELPTTVVHGYPCRIWTETKHCHNMTLRKVMDVDAGLVVCTTIEGNGVNNDTRSYFTRGSTQILNDDLGHVFSWRSQNPQLVTDRRSPKLKVIVRMGQFRIYNTSIVTDKLPSVQVTCLINHLFYNVDQGKVLQIWENNSTAPVESQLIQVNKYTTIPFYTTLTANLQLPLNKDKIKIRGYACSAPSIVNDPSIRSSNSEEFHFHDGKNCTPTIEKTDMDDRTLEIHPSDFNTDPSKWPALRCAATGNPTPVILWQLEKGAFVNIPDLGFLNGSLVRRNFPHRVESILYLNNLRQWEGKFLCAANNTMGSAKKLIRVVQYAEAPIIVSTTGNWKEKNVTISLDTRSLTCDATGVPLPTIKWKLNGVDLPENHPEPSFFAVSGKRSRSELTLPTLDYNVEGLRIYSCLASNWNGSDQVQFFMGGPSPTKLINKGSRQVILRDPGYVSCTATGNPMPHITWIKNNADFEASYTKYGLNSVQSFVPVFGKEDEGMYTCAARHSDSVKDSFIFTVHMSDPHTEEEPAKWISSGSSSYTKKSTTSIWTIFVVPIALRITLQPILF